jgi:hypothetical protein
VVPPGTAGRRAIELRAAAGAGALAAAYEAATRRWSARTAVTEDAAPDEAVATTLIEVLGEARSAALAIIAPPVRAASTR